jgi:hypothetical protein
MMFLTARNIWPTKAASMERDVLKRSVALWVKDAMGR